MVRAPEDILYELNGVRIAIRVLEEKERSLDKQYQYVVKKIGEQGEVKTRLQEISDVLPKVGRPKKHA